MGLATKKYVNARAKVVTMILIYSLVDLHFVLALVFLRQ